MADENKNAVPEEQQESGWVSPEEPTQVAEPEAAPSLQKDLSRPSAHEIYQQVAKNAKEELKRSSLSLAISGFTGGIFMGLSALGVGLALARALLALHGGQIEARSAGPGQGSEFTVRLPTGVSSSESATTDTCAIAPAANGGVKVLVVDDSRDAADSCATLLQLSGNEVRVAYNGRRALELARDFHPDAVLLDIGLPDISGYELARTIRAAPWAASVILIAVSGWGQEQDKRRALQAGFDRHLTKPIAPDALESLLQSLVASRALPPAARA
jgi:CheY-like chemotaxis protein